MQSLFLEVVYYLSILLIKKIILKQIRKGHIPFCQNIKKLLNEVDNFSQRHQKKSEFEYIPL